MVLAEVGGVQRLAVAQQMAQLKVSLAAGGHVARVQLVAALARAAAGKRTLPLPAVLRHLVARQRTDLAEHLRATERVADQRPPRGIRGPSSRERTGSRHLRSQQDRVSVTLGDDRGVVSPPRATGRHADGRHDSTSKRQRLSSGLGAANAFSCRGLVAITYDQVHFPASRLRCKTTRKDRSLVVTSDNGAIAEATEQTEGIPHRRSSVNCGQALAMRNLRLCESLSVALPTGGLATRCIAIDYDTKVVYLASDSGVEAFDPSCQQVSAVCDLQEGGWLAGGGSLLAVEPLAEVGAVCVATTTGDVLLWRADAVDATDAGTPQLECVGSVESGLRAMSWSPDQQVVVFVTGQSTLIMMTKDFEPITEVAMHPKAFGEAESVSVGWGSKQTQFHGSAGKQSAQGTPERQGSLLENDDGLTRVRWRGDGQFFCVSSVVSDPAVRCLRVWTRDGCLHSTSETVNGLEQALAWKTSGRLIASSQRRQNKHEVVFFEKNGLRHGEFTLTSESVKVKELMWNIDSTILAVWCEQLPPVGAGGVPKSYIDLWTSGNYHWYLKQRVPAAGVVGVAAGVVGVAPAAGVVGVVAAAWDAECAMCLHVVLADGAYLRATWTWATDVGGDGGQTAAVIDGNCLLVTPFDKMSVPPPMCAFKITLPCPIVAVAYASDDDCMAALLVDSRVAIFNYAAGASGAEAGRDADGVGMSYECGTPDTCQLPHLIALCRLAVPQVHLARLVLRSGLHGYVLSPSSSSSSVLISFEIDAATRDISQTECCMIPTSIFGTPFISDRSIIYQSTDGEVYARQTGEVGGEFVPWMTEDNVALRFSRPCTTVISTRMAGQRVLLGLTERFRLYINDLEVASNCTSVATHGEFLVMTTHSPHACRFIRHSDPIRVLPPGECERDRTRRGERGGRIVCLAASGTQLTLQMPRGNLEVVHPRALVMHALQRHLASFQFAAAYHMMRVHRVDLNLLYDHDPEAFLGRLPEVVTQINDVLLLNQFLTDLREEDVSRTLYAGSYPDRDAPSSTTEDGVKRGSKQDVLCDAMRAVFQQLDPQRYLLCIVTSHVKKSCPDTEAALSMINDLHAKNCESAERILKHLLFLVKVDELYKVALGMYDLQLTLLVAEKSQKDPKEYLPLLNELRRLPENYRQYKIDTHLKRYPKALVHLRKCEDKFDECLLFVEEHQLYAQALRLFTPDSDCFKAVARAYGDHLSGRGLTQEAGLAYARGAESRRAMDAFAGCLSWREALCAAERIPLAAAEMTTLARSLAERLKGEKRHDEAAILLEQYAEDTEEAIVTLIEGYHWDEALRLMYRHRRTDFIESDLKSALQTSCAQQRDRLATSGALYQHHRRRLAVVRHAKEKELLGLLDGADGGGGGGGGGGDATDLFSDTSSVGGDSRCSYGTAGRSSIHSSTSGRSSKSRRKTERKKWSLKEGGEHEEHALVDALAKLVKEVDGLKGDIASLLRALVVFHFETEANGLQTAFGETLAAIAASLTEIWPPAAEAKLAMPYLGPASTANAIALSMMRVQRSTSGGQLDSSLQMAPALNTDFKWKLQIFPST